MFSEAGGGLGGGRPPIMAPQLALIKARATYMPPQLALIKARATYMPPQLKPD